MEKDITIQNFNFLPIENSNIESANQYFIVDNNKTFLINKVPTENTRDMQYIAQVRNVKSVLGGINQMPLYSLAQQPYYVGTASDIVLPVVPNVEQANVFADNYFLQPNPDANITELTNVKVSEQFGNCDTNMQVDNQEDGAPCTEITLNDEQCQIMEQKGWVLLDLNKRVYLLDSGGAHDITDNEKMIERYRDLENNLEKEIEEDLTYIKNLDLLDTQKAAATIKEKAAQDNVLVNAIQTEHSDIFGCSQAQNGPIELKSLITDFPLDDKEFPLKNPEENDTTQKKIDKPKQNTSRKLLKIPIRTRLSSEDVPSKLFLGTMASGKKLFARVQSIQGHSRSSGKEKPNVTCRMIIDLSKTKEEIQQHEYLEYHKEAEYALRRSSIWTDKCGPDVIAATERIVNRLLAMPRCIGMMKGQRLLVTTCEKKRTSEDKPVYHLKSVVTGRAVDEKNNGRVTAKSSFFHMSHLLTYIMKQKTERKSPHGVANCIIHLHISETLHELLPPQVIATITKRSLPLKPLNSESILIINESKAKHTCKLCSEAFKFSRDLNKHQKNCLGIKEKDKTTALEQLMHNTLTAPIISLETKGDKTYTCQYCKMKFNKISAYKKHLIIHLGNDQQSVSDTADCTKDKADSSRDNQKIKCSMCAVTFMNPTMLNKHILDTHISP